MPKEAFELDLPVSITFHLTKVLCFGFCTGFYCPQAAVITDGVQKIITSTLKSGDRSDFDPWSWVIIFNAQ